MGRSRYTLVLAICLIITGCGAIYSYENDNCSLIILSSRDVQAGSVSIDSDCNVTGGADSLITKLEAIEAMTSFINKIP